MLTVALVCVPGGSYNYNHVDRLIKQVRSNLTIPHTFNITWITDKPGWWSKINLFAPGKFEGRVLYLDLDITIVDKIDDIVNIDAPFAAIKDYQYPMTINSSVMVWDAGIVDHIYTDFTSDVMENYHGDQNWINNRVPTARRFPQDWCVSYKATVLPLGFIPKGTKIVVYHGQPKPWEIE